MRFDRCKKCFETEGVPVVESIKGRSENIELCSFLNSLINHLIKKEDSGYMVDSRKNNAINKQRNEFLLAYKSQSLSSENENLQS
jgi:hypothetical protein